MPKGATFPSRQMSQNDSLSEEEAHNLATHVLPSSFLVVHDAIRGGPGATEADKEVNKAPKNDIQKNEGSSTNASIGARAAQGDQTDGMEEDH